MGVLGSIQVGSASRFSSKNKSAAAGGFRPDVNNARLETPPGPAEYVGLKTGPDFSIELEPNETPGLEANQNLLRVLSPFMIRVEPPLVYSTYNADTKSSLAKFLEAGHGAAPSAFEAARAAYKDIDLPGGPLALGKTVEAFVAGGFPSTPKGSETKLVLDPKGQGGPGRIGAPAIADVYTAVDIWMQVRALLKTPPLILLINPQTLSMSYTKKQQYTERTRYGFIFQAWGEEQPKLSIEARCGAFVSGGRGVQWASRRDSAAWQNLATAFQFYRHNGYIHDTVGKSNAHHFVGALSIHYDGWVYYGNMESFNYSFEEGQQRGGITFSMEFIVNAMVDTSKASTVVTPMRSPLPSLSDPRYMNMRQEEGVGRGDLSVSLDGEVEFGGDSPQPTTIPTAPPAFGTQRGPGLRTAPAGNKGFIPPSAAPPVSTPPKKKPVPFGGRR